VIAKIIERVNTLS